jgi:hypothetical protein
VDDFKIYRARVLLPQNAPPLVAFNDEIGWLACIDLGGGKTPSKGDMVHWDEIQRVTSVSPPVVDGTRVAFVYMFKVTKGYSAIFDFSPNLTPEMLEEVQAPDWESTFGPAIAATLQDGLVERTVKLDRQTYDQLASFGLWPVPALVPFPFGRIAAHLATGEVEAAGALLIKHCDAAFISELASKWWDHPIFAARRQLLEPAIDAHAKCSYTLSIPALIPQLEGIISDWLHQTVQDQPVPFRSERKIELFGRILSNDPQSWVFGAVIDHTMRFILEGPVLASFTKWDDAISSVFANRHAIGHGRNEAAIFTQENSIKLILLIDTLHYAVAGRALRSDEGDRSVNRV